jgi:urease accessory protein
MGESSVPDDLALSRLLRLASPALPAGAFSYSQGLETAIAQGWLRDEAAITDWVQDVLEFTLARFDAP